MNPCEGCSMYTTQELLETLNQEHGDCMYPLDVEWAHCIEGPAKWLNCRRRKANEEAEG